MGPGATMRAATFRNVRPGRPNGARKEATALRQKEGAKTTRTLGGQDEVRGGGALRQGAGQAEADDGGQQQRQRLSLAASGAGAHSQLTLRFKIPERKDVQPNQNRFGIAMVL